MLFHLFLEDDDCLSRKENHAVDIKCLRQNCDSTKRILPGMTTLFTGHQRMAFGKEYGLVRTADVLCAASPKQQWSARSATSIVGWGGARGGGDEAPLAPRSIWLTMVNQSDFKEASESF